MNLRDIVTDVHGDFGVKVEIHDGDSEDESDVFTSTIYMDISLLTSHTLQL